MGRMMRLAIVATSVSATMLLFVLAGRVMPWMTHWLDLHPQPARALRILCVLAVPLAALALHRGRLTTTATRPDVER